VSWSPYCAWYVGCPRAGKTFLAYQHVQRDHALTGWPILVVDSTEAGNFDRVSHALSAEEALIEILANKKREIAWTPRDPEDVDALARAIRAGGRMHVLVDEAAFWIGGPRGRGGALLRLLRAYRHARVSLHLTTQHFSGDVSAEALACAPQLFVFRTTSPAALDSIERNFGLPAAKVRALPERQCLRVDLGF
jgi:hypothetical protein